MKRCPKCGCEKFYVTAHVIQDWIVDCNGDYVETVEDCVEVTHFPKDDDIWTCKECGYQAAGDKFNVKGK